MHFYSAENRKRHYKWKGFKSSGSQTLWVCGYPANVSETPPLHNPFLLYTCMSMEKRRGRVGRQPFSSMQQEIEDFFFKKKKHLPFCMFRGRGERLAQSSKAGVLLHDGAAIPCTATPSIAFSSMQKEGGDLERSPLCIWTFTQVFRRGSPS